MGARPDQLLNGKYRILHEVGQGGMAVVHKGVDTALDREVAIKVLHPHLASRTDSRIRLQREARAVAKLSHPNIVEIYDYSGLDSEESFIVTEYIRGETLKDFMDRHGPNLPEIGAMIVHEIAGAVAHAHDAGIIHRDIKPENIMIRDDGRLKLMDFGIAQCAELNAMTITGALVGSPAHMSPEHVEGKTLDWRADVFSLGTLLYTLCAGRLPFESPSPHALLRQILEARYEDPRIHNPAISKKLYQIIAQCLKKEPDERFESARALQDAIASYLGEFGLNDCNAELQIYFDDAPTVEPFLTKRVVERLLEQARRHAAEGRVPAALESYNQVLALEPREDALHEVQKLSTSHSRRTVARRVLAGVFATAAVAGIVFGLTRWQGSDALPTANDLGEAEPVAVALQEAPVPAAAPATPTAPPPDEGVTSREPEGEVARRTQREPLDSAPIAVVAVVPEPKPVEEKIAGTAVEARPTLVKVDPRHRPHPIVKGPDPTKINRPAGATSVAEPKGVRVRFVAQHGAGIEFRGQFYDTGNTGYQMLPPGPYTVRVHKPDCAECIDKSHSVTVSSESPDTIAFPLGFQAATLVVNGPAGAKVRVSEQTYGVGQTIEFGMKSPTRTVVATVTKAGFEPRSVQAKLRAGHPTTSNVELSASPATP